MWPAKSRLSSLTDTDTMTELIFALIFMIVVAGAIIPLFFLKTWDTVEWLFVYGLVIIVTWGLVESTYHDYVKENTKIQHCK